MTDAIAEDAASSDTAETDPVDASAEDVTDPPEASTDADADTVASDTGEDTVSSDDPIESAEPADDTLNADGDDTSLETHLSDDSVSAETDIAVDHLTEEEAEKLIVEAETVDPVHEDPDLTTVPDDAVVPPQVIRETTIERKGGFGSMLVGGVVAAALGYGVAAYVSQNVWPFQSADDGFETEMRDAQAAQAETLSGIADRVGALEAVEIPTVDFGPVEEQIASVQATATDIASRLDGLADRVDALERQPMEQAVSPEAIAAYERALADLQAEVEAQRAEVAQMAEEAMQAEGNAEEKAQLAASRAALADLTTALETGSGFNEALGVLSANGVEVPEVLSANAETGIATQSGLIEGFPEAARAALAAARSVETESAEGTNRVATFFANQLGARSVAPREGDDPDAVLSRAEAAVRAGDLSTALTEVSALPEAAQSAIADWQSSAQTRLEAKTAADTLVQQLLQ
ncbi:mitofilin family membrane protein [Marivita sp. S6314]|uniref:COG4223 family protein n=1 Tax=Marivita sp. S6314 TaxID=2926406 RepID=UPI001FF67B60